MNRLKSAAPHAAGPVLRRAGLFAGVCLGLSACSPAAVGVASSDGWGASDEHPYAADPIAPPPKPVPRALPIPEAQRKPWEDANQLATLDQVGGRAASEHFDGSFERTVHVNTLAKAYRVLARGKVFPNGSIIVQRHFSAAGDVAALFVMSRKDARWRFQVVDSTMKIASPEDVALCARCHADAPHVGLFGPPALQKSNVTE